MLKLVVESGPVLVKERGVCLVLFFAASSFGGLMPKPVLRLPCAVILILELVTAPVFAQSNASRVVPVLAGEAKRMAVPVRFETIGTVQPIESVILRPRVEGQIIAVNFQDGAIVKAGDLLFELDSRSIDAQVRQAEANSVKTKVQLEQAERDVKRNEALAANEFASKVNLENARTQVLALQAQVLADQAALDNLKIQQGFYDIASPISGRIGIAGVKVGNIAKTGDGSTPLAVINQMTPIYVSFNVPQRFLSDLQDALEKKSGEAIATPQGATKSVTGRLAVVDNAVDTGSGTVSVRATFDNADGVLWPGALCNIRLTLKVNDDVVTVPAEAIRAGQKGFFVYVIDQGVAKLKTVKPGRTVDGRTEVAEGLQGNETVVTDGHLQLVDGVKVELKGQPQGAAQ